MTRDRASQRSLAHRRSFVCLLSGFSHARVAARSLTNGYPVVAPGCGEDAVKTGVQVIYGDRCDCDVRPLLAAAAF